MKFNLKESYSQLKFSRAEFTCCFFLFFFLTSAASLTAFDLQRFIFQEGTDLDILYCLVRKLWLLTDFTRYVWFCLMVSAVRSEGLLLLNHPDFTKRVRRLLRQPFIAATSRFLRISGNGVYCQKIECPSNRYFCRLLVVVMGQFTQLDLPGSGQGPRELKVSSLRACLHLLTYVFNY